MSAMITARTYTPQYRPDAGEVTVWEVRVEGAPTEEFTQQRTAERYATLINDGVPYREAISRAYSPDWKPDTSGTATKAQQQLVAKLVAATADENLESITMPPIDRLTKNQASWWIDKLNN